MTAKLKTLDGLEVICEVPNIAHGEDLLRPIDRGLPGPIDSDSEHTLRRYAFAGYEKNGYGEVPVFKECSDL